ncbi:hypothetical protein GQ600_27695 [Phytophthora cactorum]|nr:hypothetical protein GQ600_27695 [Phytophthora cactorum]
MVWLSNQGPAARSHLGRELAPGNCQCPRRRFYQIGEDQSCILEFRKVLGTVQDPHQVTCPYDRKHVQICGLSGQTLERDGCIDHKRKEIDPSKSQALR